MKEPTLSQSHFTIHAIGIEKMWKNNFIPIGKLFASLVGFTAFAFLFELSLTISPDVYLTSLCMFGFIIEAVRGYRNFSDAMILVQSLRKRSTPLAVSFKITCEDDASAIEDFAAHYYLDKSLRKEFNSILQKAMLSNGLDPKLLEWSVDYHLHFKNENGGVLEICVLPAAK